MCRGLWAGAYACEYAFEDGAGSPWGACEYFVYPDVGSAELFPSAGFRVRPRAVKNGVFCDGVGAFVNPLGVGDDGFLIRACRLWRA